MTWTWTFVLAFGTYAMRASAPLFLGSRQLPVLAERIVNLVAVSLIAALIATSTFADGSVAAARRPRRRGGGGGGRRLARSLVPRRRGAGRRDGGVAAPRGGLLIV